MQRTGIVLAILTTCGLFGTGPALAADDIVPIPQVPSALDIGTAGSDESSDGSVPQAPVAAEQPVTVNVQVDGGNVDVSVRVSSPGEDGSAASESAEMPVVSDSGAPGITTPTDATQPQSDAETTEGTNVNVAVRVLSPGDDAAVQQSATAGEEQQASEATDATHEGGPTSDPDSGPKPVDPSNTEDESPISTETRPQYQDENSRYQSETEFTADPWQWLWYLSVDCAGNATSVSTETGTQASPDWNWEWVWEWACNSPTHPPPLESSEQTGDREPAPSEAAPPTSGGVADRPLPAGDAPSADPGAQGEPWRWTWTFTFCGETTSATIPIAVQTELRWDWDWTWDWTCESEPTTEPAIPTPSNPSPAPATGAPAPAAEAPAASSRNGSDEAGTSTDERSGLPPLLIAGVRFPVWVIPLRPLPELESEAPISLAPLLPSLENITISVVVAPGAQPTALPQSPLAWPVTAAVDVSVAIGPEPGAPALEPEKRAIRPPVVASEASSGAATSVSKQDHATAKPAPARPPSVRPASPRREREPLAPFGQLGSSYSGGAGTSGGRVPTTPVVAVAAILAFFMLAAPGLGWRIRAARELSPRGVYRSSIDHPG